LTAACSAFVVTLYLICAGYKCMYVCIIIIICKEDHAYDGFDSIHVNSVALYSPDSLLKSRGAVELA
jgi:hypothetical protein